MDQLVPEIQSLFLATGMAESELFQSYLTPEGKSKGPVIVVYEHQFLEHQIRHQDRTGTPDADRVLLYPAEEFQTDPEFISLNRDSGADRLAELLATDTALRERMVQLGYRVLNGSDTTGTDQLHRYLTDHGIPIPDERTDLTRAELPQLDLLERLIRNAGRCSQ